MRENIKDFYGRIIGYLDRKSNGDVTAYSFYGKILGNYNKALNITKDFYGRTLASGDITASLIWREHDKKEG